MKAVCWTARRSSAGAQRRLQKRAGLVRTFFADMHLHYVTA
jgi:hypothetical protein